MARLWTILSLFVCIQIATGVLTNVALNKPANISSRLNRRELPPGGAVDGNITTTYATGIIHTPHGQNSAWWTVDLQTQVQDATVKIYFRTDAVCLSGSYGPGCTSLCTDRKCSTSSSASCHHVTGECDQRCQPGWREIDCTQVCPNGTYGASCQKSCADRHCRNPSSSCDRETGQCSPDGCQDAWMGTDCTNNCPEGTFGSDCLTCSGRHCEGESDCPADGTCSRGCQDGWTLSTCTQVCPSGTYGVGCASTCGNCTGDYACHHVTGNCPGACRPGWRGSQCKQTCLSGQYGANCEENCGQCIGTCDVVDGHCPGGCVDGYCGSRCNKKLEDPVTIAVTAAVVFVLMFVVVGGTLFCLIRSGRLKWVKAAEESTEMDDITNTQVTSETESERPQSGSRHVYNNDYAGIDVEAKPDNTEYEAIKRRHYENT